MTTNNSFSHLTLEERRIILSGIINESPMNAIAKTIGKDNLLLVKRFAFTALSLTNVRCLLNVPITVSVFMAGSVPWIVLITFLVYYR